MTPKGGWVGIYFFALNSTLCTSPAKLRTFTITVLLRRISQL
jgi:hypothetical protein